MGLKYQLVKKQEDLGDIVQTGGMNVPFHLKIHIEKKIDVLLNSNFFTQKITYNILCKIHIKAGTIIELIYTQKQIIKYIQSEELTSPLPTSRSRYATIAEPLPTSRPLYATIADTYFNITRVNNKVTIKCIIDIPHNNNSVSFQNIIRHILGYHKIYENYNTNFENKIDNEEGFRYQHKLPRTIIYLKSLNTTLLNKPIIDLHTLPDLNNKINKLPISYDHFGKLVTKGSLIQKVDYLKYFNIRSGYSDYYIPKKIYYTLAVDDKYNNYIIQWYILLLKLFEKNLSNEKKIVSGLLWGKSANPADAETYKKYTENYSNILSINHKKLPKNYFDLHLIHTLHKHLELDPDLKMQLITFFKILKNANYTVHDLLYLNSIYDELQSVYKQIYSKNIKYKRLLYIYTSSLSKTNQLLFIEQINLFDITNNLNLNNNLNSFEWIISNNIITNDDSQWVSLYTNIYINIVNLFPKRSYEYLTKLKDISKNNNKSTNIYNSESDITLKNLKQNFEYSLNNAACAIIVNLLFCVNPTIYYILYPNYLKYSTVSKKFTFDANNAKKDLQLKLFSLQITIPEKVDIANYKILDYNYTNNRFQNDITTYIDRSESSTYIISFYKFTRFTELETKFSNKNELIGKMRALFKDSKESSTVVSYDDDLANYSEIIYKIDEFIYQNIKTKNSKSLFYGKPRIDAWYVLFENYTDQLTHQKHRLAFPIKIGNAIDCKTWTYSGKLIYYNPDNPNNPNKLDKPKYNADCEEVHN